MTLLTSLFPFSRQTGRNRIFLAVPATPFRGQTSEVMIVKPEGVVPVAITDVWCRNRHPDSPDDEDDLPSPLLAKLGGIGSAAVTDNPRNCRLNSAD